MHSLATKEERMEVRQSHDRRACIELPMEAVEGIE